MLAELAIQQVGFEPNWALLGSEYRFSAVDQNGDLYVYTHKPHTSSFKWLFPDNIVDARCMFLGNVSIQDGGIANWRETLRIRTEA